MTRDQGKRPVEHGGFHAYRSTTDPQARHQIRERLVNDHMGLAHHMARRFSHRGVSDDDLIQVASVGLLHAIERFDPDRGVEFSTFAAPTIVGEIKRHFRDKGWAIRVPRRLQELHLRTTTVADELTNRLGRSPNISELAAAARASEEEVLEALDASRAYRARPLTRPNGEDGDIESTDLSDDDLALVRSENRVVVDQLLARLGKRDQLILRMRFFEEMTQLEIAERLGVSQMQVSRLLNRVLTQLRDEAAETVD